MTDKKQVPQLMDEPPLLVYPSLAVTLGLNRAIVFQQLHFLLNGQKAAKNKYNLVDGHWWVYNSYTEWRNDYFPWLSTSTIKGIFNSLEDELLVIARQSVKYKSDRRKWYTIDYEVWDKKCLMMGQKMSHEPTDKNCPMDGTKNVSSNGQNLSNGYSETPSKTSTETFSESKGEQPPARPNIFGQYENVFGTIPGAMVDVLKDAATTWSAEWIEAALLETATNNGKSWKYTLRILERWQREGRPSPAVATETATEYQGTTLFDLPPAQAADPLDTLAGQVDEAHRTAWQVTLGQLEAQYDPASYNTWLKDLRLIEVKDSVFVLAARNQFALEACQGRFYKSVRRLIRDASGLTEADARFVTAEEVIRES